MNLFSLFLQSDNNFLAGLLGSTVLIAISMLAILAIVFLIAGWWKMFDKAAQPGWMAIIPILNIFILVRIAGRPWWWAILYLIPLVQIFIGIIVALDLGETFGKDRLFSFLLLFLVAPVGYLLLGFGDAQYKGSAEPFNLYKIGSKI